MGLLVSEGPNVNGASLKTISPALISRDATICLKLFKKFTTKFIHFSIEKKKFRGRIRISLFNISCHSLFWACLTMPVQVLGAVAPWPTADTISYGLARMVLKRKSCFFLYVFSSLWFFPLKNGTIIIKTKDKLKLGALKFFKGIKYTIWGAIHKPRGQNFGHFDLLAFCGHFNK